MRYSGHINHKLRKDSGWSFSINCMSIALSSRSAFSLFFVAYNTVNIYRIISELPYS